MQVFNYDPANYRSDLQSGGYALLKDLLTPGFVSYIADFHKKSMAEQESESLEWKISGKKRQFVFDFPSERSAFEFRHGMAHLTDINEDDFTISERHLKVYDENAAPYPCPHKDRSASHYSVGIPVDLPDGSSVCVFPNLEPGNNEEDHAVFITDRDDPEATRFYQSDDAILLNEEVGDLIIFLGSALYHERVKAAGTSVLYLKVNGAGVDPLGENIYS